MERTNEAPAARVDPSGPPSAARAASLVVLVGAVLGPAFAAPVLFWGLSIAASSLEPYADNLRSFLAILAIVAFAMATVLLTPLAIALRSLRPVRRLGPRIATATSAATAALGALPLFKAATNDVGSSSIGHGATSFELLSLGAVGLGLALTILLIDRPSRAWLALALFGLMLAAVGLARDV